MTKPPTTREESIDLTTEEVAELTNGWVIHSRMVIAPFRDEPGSLSVDFNIAPRPGETLVIEVPIMPGDSLDIAMTRARAKLAEVVFALGYPVAR